MHQTRRRNGNIACYRLLPSVTTHSLFTKSVVISTTMSKVGAVHCRASGEKSMDSIVGYLTISTNLKRYQTSCQRQYYSPFSNTDNACTSAWCTQQFNSCCAKLSTSFLLSYGTNTTSSNWLNSGKALIQHLNEKM